MKRISFLLIIVFLLNSGGIVFAQSNPSFAKVEMLVPNGNETSEKSVVVTFKENLMEIEAKNSSLKKTFNYSDIKAAEYSYSKNPRWKTGLGLGAASLVFPPLLLIAIPVGFTKHRRHWLTIRTENDYAVLKLSKSTRKLFMPTFETKSGIKIEALGEDK
ncbi:MAG TPA: hypothetical protein VK892_13745 [Pyrinomonadaceae bacterium]|nr:hypothetical protein [Pyrinomonadaceae bacterium]